MKHAILGVGAIGGLMGTTLGALGEDVTLIVRLEKLEDYPKLLILEQPNGTVTAPAKPVSRLETPVDVLWISTKTYQMQTALALARSSSWVALEMRPSRPRSQLLPTINANPPR